MFDVCVWHQKAAFTLCDVIVSVKYSNIIFHFLSLSLSLHSSGAASHHTDSHIGSSYCPSLWHVCDYQVWSHGQPPSRVSDVHPDENLLDDHKTLWLSTYCTFRSNSYKWTKDGHHFVPPQLLPGKGGTFVLHDKQLDQFQGKYRCYAFNKHGTAMTAEIELIVPRK